jgi:uncharacterized membrane protein YgcG
LKCAHCLADAKYKERSDGKCPACRRAFVFEPQKGDVFTDVGFQAALRRVSGDGTVKFNASNLFYELKKVKKSVLGTYAPPVALMAGFASVVGVTQGAPLIGGVIAVVGGTFAALLYAGRQTHSSLTRQQVLEACRRWQAVNGAPPGLILRKAPSAQVSEALQAELESYSFDRAVITDTAETAELLLANDFHFENNCAVLSVDGSPTHAFEPVRRMLRKNPRLEIFALHDCTPEGCGLAFRLKHDPAWFKEFGTVYDVALRPLQARAKALAALREPAEGNRSDHPSLSKAEAAWLAQWSLRLAAIRPEQLIKRLYRSMQKLPPGDGGDGGVVAWSTDASASDGGGDSFG